MGKDQKRLHMGPSKPQGATYRFATHPVGARCRSSFFPVSVPLMLPLDTRQSGSLEVQKSSMISASCSSFEDEQRGLGSTVDLLRQCPSLTTHHRQMAWRRARSCAP